MLQALLKIEMPDEQPVASNAAVRSVAADALKLESLASPQKAPRTISWGPVIREIDLCKDDPYMVSAGKQGPACSAVDNALHRLGTDDIQDCVTQSC